METWNKFVELQMRYRQGIKIPLSVFGGWNVYLMPSKMLTDAEIHKCKEAIESKPRLTAVDLLMEYNDKHINDLFREFESIRRFSTDPHHDRLTRSAIRAVKGIPKRISHMKIDPPNQMQLFLKRILVRQ